MPTRVTFCTEGHILGRASLTFQHQNKSEPHYLDTLGELNPNF